MPASLRLLVRELAGVNIYPPPPPHSAARSARDPSAARDMFRILTMVRGTSRSSVREIHTRMNEKMCELKARSLYVQYAPQVNFSHITVMILSRCYAVPSLV